MQHNIIEKLFASFSDLETAIDQAKKTLGPKHNVPESVLERLGSYDTILNKQRKLAESLCKSIEGGNKAEQQRLVQLITSLSKMIRDDAKALLSSYSPSNTDKPTLQEDDIYYC